MAGLYVHIPFCASRCIYCSFYSTTAHSLQHEYVTALCKEMILRKDYTNIHGTQDDNTAETINTIYIGGGTPSVLSSEELRILFAGIYSTFGTGQTETTVEVNPDDVTPTLVSTLCELGVNRVSMGAQTFNDAKLKFLHRRHTAAQVDKAVNMLRQRGINNISVDLIFGLPCEDMDDWLADIRHVLHLDINHISAYSLMYETGTPLYKMKELGTVKDTDEDTSRKMYDSLINSLTDAGYEHYEISNFAKPGYRSLHNSSYWNDIPYLGIGAAAHSYNRHSRQWNVANICEYISSINASVIPTTIEEIDERTHYNDTVTTALRTTEGIAIDKLHAKYREYIISNAKTYINSGLMTIDNGRLRITRKGIFVSDMIMSDLIMI